jgi:hypothetical protein
VRDTPPEVQEIYRSMLMARTGPDRLRMGCDLFSTARGLVASSLAEKRPEAIREDLFLRFYASDFTPSETTRILSCIRAHKCP